MHPLAYTALVARQPWVRPTPRQSWPRCLAASGLYGRSCTAAFGFGFILGRSWPCCLADIGFRSSSYSAASTKADPNAIVASLIVSLRLIGFQLHRSLRLGPASTTIVATLLAPFGLHGPSCSAALGKADPTTLMASLLGSIWPTKPQLLGSLRLRPESTAIVAFQLVRLRPLKLQQLGSLG